MKAKGGFTLVEILICGIILSILAAIVIPQFTEITIEKNMSLFCLQMTASAILVLAGLWGYSRKMNIIIQSLRNSIIRLWDYINKADEDGAIHTQRLRREFDRLSTRISELERKIR